MTPDTNVSTDEINKFEMLAQKWWDANGPMKMLHVINPLRVKFITDNVTIKNKKILDIGCGAGLVTEAVARLGADATGIDLAGKVIDAANHHAKKSKLDVTYHVTDIENYSKNFNKKFDVILCLEMLEHVPNPKKIIATCKNLLVPGGSIFFSTINRNLKSFLFAILGAEYILRILPVGTHSYKKLIRPDELIKWSTSYGLKLQDCSSFIYNPFTKKFRLKPGADVNYIMHFKNQEK